MKRNKYTLGVMAAAALLSASCTDFSDYNEAFSSGSQESQQTLWQNIQSDANLTQFAELVRLSGFDKQLNGDQYYTVFAPLNGTFDADYQRYRALPADTILQRFVYSHVANFSREATGTIDQAIHSLNDKSFRLQNDADNGGYSYGSNHLATVNRPGSNGLLHTMNGAVEFRPNVYEYIFDAVGCDSVKNFFAKYEVKTLNLKKSTEGDINEMGLMEYTDSVFDISNVMTDRDHLNARITVEDSSYTMILPTNRAYADAYNKIKSYFNYHAQTPYTKFSGQVSTDMTQTVETEYLSDSLTRMFIAQSMFFNNNSRYNRWTQGNLTTPQDTLVSTVYQYFSNGRDFVAPSSPYVTQKVALSNGEAHVIDSLPIKPWEGWCPGYYVSATNNSTRAHIDGMTPNNITASYSDFNWARYTLPEGYTGIRYLECLVSTDRSAPKLDFYMPNTLSTTYYLYVVMVPSDVYTLSRDRRKSYKFSVSMTYGDANGKLKEEKFKAADGTVNFISDSTKIDTMLIGKVTLPIAYAYIPKSDNEATIAPYVHIESTRNKLSNRTGEWDLYDNRLRIAGVMLIPEDFHEEWRRLNITSETEEAEEE